MKYLISGILFLLLFAGDASALEIKSRAFRNGTPIPTRHTGDSLNVSPPLAWKGAPAGTRSFALICDDPDAPGRIFVHWVIYNIPAEKSDLEEDVSKKERLTDGTLQGRNDTGRIGYLGPAPPPGKPHRYFFKLYALDIQLKLKPGAKKAGLEEAMRGHVLAEASLMGTYQR